MQAAASIGLLLMSVSTQPGFSQQQQHADPARSVASAPAQCADGITGSAAGAGAEADGASLSSRYGKRLYEAESGASGSRGSRTRRPTVPLPQADEHGADLTR